MVKMKVSSFNSPIGSLVVGSHQEQLHFIEHVRDERSHDWLRRRKIAPDRYELVKDCTFNNQVINQLTEYFKGVQVNFNLPLNLVGTPFQKEVWNALYQIPYGQLVTYKDIAYAINRPKAVRAVGGAVNKNPISVIIPCHRVIGSNGNLVGYEGGLDRKRALLNLETKDEQWLKISQ
ncbi:methylated-DNA--[protein]-cysteine S-methyltransferase [Alkalibacillus silvisoli]|uniref:Methylated-DNA--protein-cysteine methyltransferase n=1 Tax=Alkalibacillus silvisoli TaxID=392823 RepID=A0ABN1A9C8_9BACI